MNRKRIFMLIIAVLLCLFRAQAAEEHVQIDTSSQELFWSLPEEARDLMQGIAPEQAADHWDTAITQMLQRLDTHRFIASAMRSLTKMLLIAVMIGVLNGLRGAAGGSELPVTTMAGALGMTGILLHDLRGMLALCIKTLEQTSVFSTTLLPVMAGAMTASGTPAAATATQAATMLALDLLIRFITSLLVPAVCAYIAIITVNAALGNDILGGLAGFVKWLTTGSLKFILTIFIAYLSISGALSGSVDAVTLKTAKFALSGSVPVVGGIISDATESMLAGMTAIKNTIGIFGMLGVLAICAAPFLQVGINYLLFKTGTAAISPICSGSLEKLMAGLSDSFGLMLGMIGTCSAVLFFELVFSIMMVKPI
ncbi:MAG: stage III sporulation protein AE [Clostridiaceae bacterium]|nr:stage III sporulation protein AE [Clostridiaceae bacterium]